MGVRTIHYDHKLLRSQEESQPQNNNQPIIEPIVQVQGAAGNQVVAIIQPNVVAPPPPSAKGKAGKGKKKAKPRTKANKSQQPPPQAAVVVAPVIPKQQPTIAPIKIIPAAAASTAKIQEPVQKATPPPVVVETVVNKKKRTPSNKLTLSYTKKRKPRGGKGKGQQQQNGKIPAAAAATEVQVVEKVENKKNARGKSESATASLHISSMKSLSPSVDESSSSSVEINNGKVNGKTKLEVDEPMESLENNTANGILKNGILKVNKNLKKGMRNLMERTNKILERSRNIKKPPRKKSPVKPRILPARASARLCVRKNSGEHDQCMMRSDIPLRTVELIKRPLELREPATKLLYMASLALYPTADPESDTTPIVIISEEIPNPGGKKPKIRSMELPLLPNWRSANFHSSSSSRATVLDDPILLSIQAIVSPPPDMKNSNGVENKPKPSRKRKPAEKKKQNNKEEIAKASIEEDAVLLKGNQKVKQTTSAEDKKKLSVTPPPVVSSSSVIREDLAQSNAQLNAHTIVVQPTQQPVLTPASVGNNSTDTVTVQPNTNNKAGKSAPGKRKRKSLETIIKEIPKTKSQKIDDSSVGANKVQPLPTVVSTEQLKDLLLTSDSIKLPSSNSICDGLMITPFNNNNNNNNNAAVIQPNNNNAVKSAPMKRNHKSLDKLDMIIKEIPIIPMTESQPKVVVDSPAHEPLLPLPVTSEQLNLTSNFNNNKLPSINPILEGLMKIPVNSNKKRSSSNKPKVEQPLTMSPLNLQNPVSMTVPLQPAPGNSNINTSIMVPQMVVKVPQAGGKQRSKKPKPQQQPQQQYQLPMPLPIPIPPGLLNYMQIPAAAAANPTPPKPKPKRVRKPKPKVSVTAAILGVPMNNNNNNNLPHPPQQRQPHDIHPQHQHHHHQLASIPYLPSHLEAYYHSTTPVVGNGIGNVKEPSIMSSSMLSYHNNNQDHHQQPMDLDQALDLCVNKAQPITVPPKKAKKAKATTMKSLLKPLNVEEDGPLNLVMARGIPQQGPTMMDHTHTSAGGKKPTEPIIKASSTSPTATENMKQQGNLENVKQMLARLHTKIAPAVNGVQLITIE